MVQQRPVMADQHKGADIPEAFVQQADSLPVQVAGRFIQQKESPVIAEHFRQAQALRFAAAHSRLALHALNAQPAERLRSGVGFQAVRELLKIKRRAEAFHRAFLGLQRAAQQVQQGGFSRPVQAHQADTVPFIDPQPFQVKEFTFAERNGKMIRRKIQI